MTTPDFPTPENSLDPIEALSNLIHMQLTLAGVECRDNDGVLCWDIACRIYSEGWRAP